MLWTDIYFIGVLFDQLSQLLCFKCCGAQRYFMYPLGNSNSWSSYRSHVNHQQLLSKFPFKFYQPLCDNNCVALHIRNYLAIIKRYRIKYNYVCFISCKQVATCNGHANPNAAMSGKICTEPKLDSKELKVWFFREGTSHIWFDYKNAKMLRNRRKLF